MPRSAFESESDRRYRKRLGMFRRYNRSTPLELRFRRYEIHRDSVLLHLMFVRRWFAKEFPPVIREHVMTFLEHKTAMHIAVLEMQINHPQLTEALKRRMEPESDMEVKFPLDSQLVELLRLA